MKRLGIPVTLIILSALLLAACAAKTVWLPLFDSPDPNRTPGLIDDLSPTPKPSDGSEDANKIFKNDVESMSAPRIVVYKSKNVLELWDGDTLMARLKAAMGKNDGPKQKSGDGKTPEGTYYICKSVGTGQYYKSLFFSYPNADDALAGLNDEKITQAQYDEIASAIDRQEIPLWNTKLGGEIAISGTGTIGKGLEGNWTGGNVALSDEDMDYLLKYVTLDVEVEINP